MGCSRSVSKPLLFVFCISTSDFVVKINENHPPIFIAKTYYPWYILCKAPSRDSGDYTEILKLGKSGERCRKLYNISRSSSLQRNTHCLCWVLLSCQGFVCSSNLLPLEISPLRNLIMSPGVLSVVGSKCRLLLGWSTSWALLGGSSHLVSG